MKLPKVYISEDGYVTIVFGQNHAPDECNVTIMHDRGLKFSIKQDAPRFVYHGGSAYGDSGYFSFTNDRLYKDERKFNLVKSKKK